MTDWEKLLRSMSAPAPAPMAAPVAAPMQGGYDQFLQADQGNLDARRIEEEAARKIAEQKAQQDILRQYETSKIGAVPASPAASAPLAPFDFTKMATSQAAPARKELAGPVGSKAMSAKMSVSGSSSGATATPKSAVPASVVPPLAPFVPKETYGAGMDDAALLAAQKDATQNRLVAGLGTAGDTIAKAISGGAYKGDEAGFYKGMAANADQGVKDIALRREGKDGELKRESVMHELAQKKEKADPKSPISVATRDFMKSLGRPVPETTSAEDVDKLLPFVTLHVQKELAREATRANIALRLDEKQAKRSEGAIQTDKDYAKDYNDWTQKDAVNMRKSIEGMKGLIKELKADGGLIQAGGGRAAPLIPDALRAENSIRWRDQARNFANPTLKYIFPGAISDDERTAAAKEYYNDSLPNARNAEMLARKVQQAEETFARESAKAKFYEDNGKTLDGYVGADSTPETKVINGKTYKKVAGGWKEVK